MPNKGIILLNSAAIAHDLMSAGESFSGHLTTPLLRYGENEIEVLGTMAIAPGGTELKVDTPCHWVLSPNWRASSPIVFCRAPWVRKSGANWHVNANGSLCYVHPSQWYECFQKIEGTLASADVQTVLVEFAYNNLRWLLRRHLEGYYLNLTDWPSSWPQWLHGPDGPAQYQAEGPSLLDKVHVRERAYPNP
jgi:hypothetical protein